jgi:Putative binding domain, N-terminal
VPCGTTHAAVHAFKVLSVMQTVLVTIRTLVVPLATGLLLALAPAPALGQSITDPTAAEFDPSADHNATTPDGTALVVRYELQFYMAGAAAPFQTGSLGKPAIGTGGRIRVTLASVFANVPTPGIIYESRVAAVGPGGTGTSAASNSFTFSAPCSFSVAPANQSIAPPGGSGNESVTAGSGCAWTAASNASWLTVTSGQNGSGSGTVGFRVAANTSPSSRSATLTVAGRAVPFTQAGVSCTVGVSPTSQSIGASGGTGSSSVTSPTGCGWTASSDASWVTITSGATGTGNGTVSYLVEANSGLGRTGTLTIGGQTATVVQSESLPASPGGFRIVRPPPQ